jgi:hypothetical protein
LYPHRSEAEGTTLETGREEGKSMLVSDHQPGDVESGQGKKKKAE